MNTAELHIEIVAEALFTDEQSLVLGHTVKVESLWGDYEVTMVTDYPETTYSVKNTFTGDETMGEAR